MKPRTDPKVGFDAAFVRFRAHAPNRVQWVCLVLSVVLGALQAGILFHHVWRDAGSVHGNVSLLVGWSVFLGAWLGIGVSAFLRSRSRRALGTWDVSPDEIPPPVATAVFRLLAAEGASPRELSKALDEVAMELRALGQESAAELCERRAKSLAFLPRSLGPRPN